MNMDWYRNAVFVFGAVFVAASLALRITELRSTLELMVDALRRPRRP